MAISRMKPENQVALLREAAKKVRTTRIPHVIDEDHWVARPADNVVNIQYDNRLRFKLGSNVRNAISSFNSKDSLYELFNDRKATRFDQLKESALMAFFSLKYVSRSTPDSEVNGNLVHWMEHSMHIALFSPAVAGAVYDMLTAEADRIEKITKAGQKATVSKELMDLAKMLAEKKVWDYSSRRFEPQTKLELIEGDLAGLFNELVPGRTVARKFFPREQIAAMRDDADAVDIAHQINRRYGALSPKRATQLLEKQWKTAAGNYLTTKRKGEDSSYWLKAAKVVGMYLTALGSKTDLRVRWNKTVELDD